MRVHTHTQDGSRPWGSRRCAWFTTTFTDHNSSQEDELARRKGTGVYGTAAQCGGICCYFGVGALLPGRCHSGRLAVCSAAFIICTATLGVPGGISAIAVLLCRARGAAIIITHAEAAASQCQQCQCTPKGAHVQAPPLQLAHRDRGYAAPVCTVLCVTRPRRCHPRASSHNN